MSERFVKNSAMNVVLCSTCAEGYENYTDEWTIINATPHRINMLCNGCGSVAIESDCVANAEMKELSLGSIHGVELVKTFPTPSGDLTVVCPPEMKNPIIVGSIVAAQAYPGEIVAMVPVPGFERVPPPHVPVEAVKSLMVYYAKCREEGWGTLVDEGSANQWLYDIEEQTRELLKTPSKLMLADKFIMFDWPLRSA